MNDTLLKVILTAVRFIFNIFFVVVFVLLLYRFTSTAFNFARNISSSGNPDEKGAREVTVTISQGATASDVADVLEEAELISSAEWFRIQSRLGGMDGMYKSGTYTLNTNMGDEDLMEILTTGVSVEEMLTLTIPEGYTAAQISKALQELGLCTDQEFREAMNSGNYDYEFLEGMPERNTRLEGYLFPDTYFINKSSSPEEIISKMLARFEQVYKEESEHKTVSMPLDEVIKRASIIEAEIKISGERAICASVIQNRLDAGIALQMDATVQYALGERKKRLLIKDLEIDSPYNTYKFSGLPIGPIGNPGRESIRAALNPADTDYMYYVVNDLELGTHEFLVTYDEFLVAKAKYQSLIN